jgi:microcystin-dependent protein
MVTGSQVYLTTTGGLPTGLAANTNYFVISTGANTFNLATSFANAIAGTTIATSGTQSGTHTLFHAPYGVASSTTFNLPNFTGRTPVGIDTSQTEFNSLGEAGGSKTHTLTTAEIPGHTHPNSLTGTTTFAADGHGHGVNSNFTAGYFAGNGFAFTLGGTVVSNGSTGTGGNSSSASVGISNGTNVGGGGAHNNLQPYIVTNYIIRVL